MSDSLIDGLRDCIDCILDIPASLGLVIHPVSMVERSWSGGELGKGQSSEVVKRMSPQPEIVDYSHSFRLEQNGAYQQGDLLLRRISKNQFKTESELLTTTKARNKERFYLIGSKRYNVVNVREELLWWEVQVRKMAP